MLVNEQSWWKQQAWTAVITGDGAEAHQRATRCIIFEKQMRGRIFETETVNRYYHFVSQALRIPMDWFFYLIASSCIQQKMASTFKLIPMNYYWKDGWGLRWTLQDGLIFKRFSIPMRGELFFPLKVCLKTFDGINYIFLSKT